MDSYYLYTNIPTGQKQQFDILYLVSQINEKMLNEYLGVQRSTGELEFFVVGLMQNRGSINN